MEKLQNMGDALFVFLTTTTGLVYIKDVLGIIILVIECVYIVARLGFKLWEYLKDRKLTDEEKKELKQDVKDTIDSLNDLIDGNKEDKDGKD